LVQYQDILKMKNIDSADTSSIDSFIKRKFEEAGRMVNDLEKRRISINPQEDYIVKEFEHAVLIQNN
jgi:voltage-gated potassium channel